MIGFTFVQGAGLVALAAVPPSMFIGAWLAKRGRDRRDEGEAWFAGARAKEMS